MIKVKVKSAAEKSIRGEDGAFAVRYWANGILRIVEWRAILGLGRCVGGDSGVGNRQENHG